jgi:prepilin-type N-terminal cleavage/methylation domain-containing protein
MKLRCGTGAKQISGRPGFTLLELILALALIVVATSLIGSLMSLYVRSFSSRGEDVRRKQLARGVMTMIADDLRAVITEQKYDEKAFEQLIGPGAADFSLLMQDGADPSLDAATAGTATDQSIETGLDGASLLSGTLGGSVPPGIYCIQNQLMVDVSRVPRTDELLVQQMTLGQLVDVPGDVKRITYYVQATSQMGVQDEMAEVTSGNLGLDATIGSNGGLVRRQLDRAVTEFSEQNGLSGQLLTTGDLVAPEVVALEFAFFDGVQWTYQWDSSQQGLPWLVQITLAIQSATGAERERMQPGVSLATLDLQQRQALGIEVYEMTVAIPGSQLQAIPADDSDATGTEDLGL